MNWTEPNDKFFWQNLRFQKNLVWSELFVSKSKHTWAIFHRWPKTAKNGKGREKNGRKGEVFYWNISSSNRQRRQVKKVIKLTKTRDKTRHSKAKKNRKLKDKKKKLSLTYSKSRIPKGLTDQFFWVWGGGGVFSVVPIRWNVV